MFHLDGSEISWLVYADWLEDHDIDSSHIRKFEQENCSWHYEYRNNRCVIGVGPIVDVLDVGVPFSFILNSVGTGATEVGCLVASIVGTFRSGSWTDSVGVGI